MARSESRSTTTIAMMGLWAAGALLVVSGPVLAGGGPESTLVLIDPDDPDSLYLGNYYVKARNVPPLNVIYLSLDASDYADFLQHHLKAVLGELANRSLEGQIDYIVFASSRAYRVPASQYITDPSCTGLSHFSLSSVFTLARHGNAIVAGNAGEDYGLRTSEVNGYFSQDDSCKAFQSSVGWSEGVSTNGALAPRYIIGAMLGYTGPGGNTPAEIVAMIDRSVAADGTRPTGTFYFMETTDFARSGPRHGYFPDAIDSLVTLGGQAEQITGFVLPDLPVPKHDCLGIMTGWPDPQIAEADMTILPGAFCDHLTSWAGIFDQTTQTTVAAWIAKGASGSLGAVDEPCNEADKFPHPRMHAYYFQGLSLGESVFRSLGYVPFQTLLYGDPLTQPFAQIPEIAVMTWTGSSIMLLNPRLLSAPPGVEIDHFDFFVDGVLTDSVAPGQTISLSLLSLTDGPHELRMVGYDDTPIATQARWMEWISVDNLGRSASLSIDPPAGDLSTAFACQVSASGGDVSEIRLLQNNRVIAATSQSSDTLVVTGATLGGGPVQLMVEASFTDGKTARSSAIAVDVDYGGACCMPNGSCLQLSSGACQQSHGGVYSGDGTACASSSCSGCGTGDVNTNGSVDFRDAALLLECFSGAGIVPDDNPPGRQALCLCAFDFDDDQDVDLTDYGEFSARLTGPRSVVSNATPVAFGYTKDIQGYEPTIVELPASDAEGNLTYTVLTPPAQATLEGDRSLRKLRPLASATGADSLVYQVDDGSTTTEPVPVEISYPDSPPESFTVTVSGLGEPEVPVSCDPPDLGGFADYWTPFVATYPNDGGSVTLTAPQSWGVSPFIHWVVDGEVLSGQAQVTVPVSQNVSALATYLPARLLDVRSDHPGVSVTVTLADVYDQGDGVAPFDRTYAVTDGFFYLEAPPNFGGRNFRHWRLDGVQLDSATSLFIQKMDADHEAVAVYSIPGDYDGDDDVDLLDFAWHQLCFSESLDEPGFQTPTPECLSAFDLETPIDGDVDLADYVQFAQQLTGAG